MDLELILGLSLYGGIILFLIIGVKLGFIEISSNPFSGWESIPEENRKITKEDFKQLGKDIVDFFKNIILGVIGLFNCAMGCLPPILLILCIVYAIIWAWNIHPAFGILLCLFLFAR